MIVTSISKSQARTKLGPELKKFLLSSFPVAVIEVKRIRIIMDRLPTVYKQISGNESCTFMDFRIVIFWGAGN